MSKKQKRSVSRSTPAAGSISSAPTGTFVPSAEPRPITTSRSSAAEFNPDYSYVIRDLKRIGVLAGSFFAILILLSFILK